MRAPPVIADYSEKPHPLVAETQHEYRHAKKNNADAPRPERGPCLSVNVTPGALHRAMGILNAILVALDTRGYTTKIEIRGPAGCGWA